MDSCIVYITYPSFSDIHQKPILQKFNIKAVGDKLNNSVMTQNGQFCLIHNFSNFFSTKWLRLTRNGQFCLIATFPIFSNKVAQNDSEWLILPDSQLFQSFLTEVAQNVLEWPILPCLQLFQSFPTEVTQNALKWPILTNSQLFQSFPTKVAQNDSE